MRKSGSIAGVLMAVSLPGVVAMAQGGLLSGAPGSHPAARVFQGIPSAAPPIGVLRRRPQQSATHGEGVCSDAETGVAQKPPAIEYYRLVPGFLPEQKNALGFATGTGFARPNPWGAYTAYLMATNVRGQRTWRIENYLQ
ncbi:MAG TPA: hypothetical protein VKU00_14680, partial [Chthonomonadaceae bacterium]|nr:hypothetical protein [Chthonomonadaceae bacterium]